MKKPVLKISTWLSAILLMLPLISFGQDQKEPTAKQIYNYTKSYIKSHHKNGAFKVYDSLSNRTLDLEKVTEIREVKCHLGNNQYYNCATLDAKDGNNYDIDFFFTWTGDSLTMNHVILHKTNSKPRYVWYIDANTGLWRALTVCGIDYSMDWQNGKNPKVNRHLTTSPIVFNEDHTRPIYVWFKDEQSGNWYALKVCGDAKDINKLYKG